MTSVLVLDDRQTDRHLLSILLGYAGYEVCEASTGAQALAVAHSEHPDLIITDILMPTMNGYEFVRQLRGEPDIGETPVVFCTANYGEDEVRRLAEACGVSHFISKPSDPETVIKTVGEALGKDTRMPEPVPVADFDREQLRLLNDKLVEKVTELEASNAERQKLVGQLFHAHEEERRLIVQGIHDDSIQAVVAVGMRLGMLKRQIADPELAGALDRLHEHVLHAVDRLRRLMFDLQPVELERQGLAIALKVHLEQARDEDGLDFLLDDRTRREPAEATRALIYLMGREAIANVRKHAHASRLDVVLEEYDSGLLVRVHDDGRGFEVEDSMRVRPGHVGLPAMRERVESAGGSLTVQSRPGEGSVLEVRVPEVPDVETAPESSR
jgi:signal transduction histidine kinase